MSKYDNTKFYWLQLKEDFFDDEAINWLEEQPNGKEYCLFYLKLCLKSLKTSGIMIRRVGEIFIPYDSEKLASITNTEIDTVVVAMQLLKEIGLIKVLENGELYLTQVEKMIGSKSIGAFKKQQQRLRGGQRVDKCPIELELELELNKEKKENNIKEKKIQKNNKNFIPPTKDEVIEYAKFRNRLDIADRFYDYFSAGNWIDSKGQKVKNWKQKFITWETHNNYNQNQNNKTKDFSGREEIQNAIKRVSLNDKY